MSKETYESQFMNLIQNYTWKEWPDLPGQSNDIRCGVLVPTVFTDDILVYAGVRSSGLEKHAGEICFPGGRPEAGDEDLRATALREAQEEMDIASARILGRLSSMPLYTSNYRLEPYVGVIDGPKPVADGSELVKVIEVSMRERLSRSCIHALGWDNQGERSLSPVFELDDRIMFGATAYVLYEFMTLAAKVLDLEVPVLQEGPYTWPEIMASTRRLPK